MKGKYIVRGISFPDPELLQMAKEKASLQRRSLSNYVCGVLEKDLKNPATEKSESFRMNDKSLNSNDDEISEAAGRVISAAAGGLPSKAKVPAPLYRRRPARMKPASKLST